MEEGFQKICKASISEVFETMFFLFPQPAEPGCSVVQEALSGGRWIAGRIVLVETGKRVLRLAIPVELGKVMAGNFLGKERELVEDGELLDMVKEAINMVGGCLLNTLDPGGRGHLSPPEAQWLEEKERQELIRGDSMIFDVDGSCCVLKVESHEQP